MTIGAAQPSAPEAEVRILDLGTVVLERWRTVLTAVAVVTVLAVLVWLVLPDVYTARTVLLPQTASQSPGRAELIASQLAGMPDLGIGGDSEQRLFGAVLKSRSVADAVVEFFRDEGGVDPEEEREIRETLAEDTELRTNPDGSLVVTVRNEDPERATRIANALPPLTNQMLAQVGAEAAARKQAFLENQLVHARRKLEQSEEELLDFQGLSHAPDLSDQAKRTIEAAVDLQRGIIQKEIEISQLHRAVTPDNPVLTAAQAELRARREQLRRLMSGTRVDDQVFLSLRESPELRVASTRLLREFSKNEQIYISLTAALAQTQIDANNDLPTVTVLDHAVVPGNPSGVGLAPILVLATLLGTIAGLIIAFLREHMERSRRDGRSERFFRAWEDFKSEVARYLPHRVWARLRPPLRS